jgi:hypothetical protein
MEIIMNVHSNNTHVTLQYGRAAAGKSVAAPETGFTMLARAVLRLVKMSRPELDVQALGLLSPNLRQEINMIRRFD